MATNRPLVNATADLDELDAITSPLEVARRIGAFARRFGTLPKPLADRRVAALLLVRKSTAVVDIAEELGLSSARISQLTRPTSPREVGA